MSTSTSTKPMAPSGTIEVQQFIDSQRFSPYQWLILVLCFLILWVDGFDTASIGYVAPALTREWGVSKLALSPLLSASLIGLALGALAAGPFADKFGRKIVLLVSVLIFGLFSLACAYADSLTTLTAWRFVTGLGLGAAMPNATTLISEYVPARRRGLLVNLMFCGFALGAAGGGFIAASIIPAYGWRSVFIVGGIMPLVLAALLLVLPESIRFMVIREWPVAKIRRVLARIAGVAVTEITATKFTLHEDQSGIHSSPLSVILSPRYLTGTLMLWLTYFMAMLVFYLTTSWLPTLIKDSGMTLQDASRIASLLPLGGTLGAIVCGWLMDWLDTRRVIGVAYFFAGIFLWALGQAVGHLGYLSVITFGSGLFIGGALASMSALAASYYPTQGRASGVAWMLGVGRFGGVLGAVAGGTLLQLGLGFSTILGLLAIPAFIASAAVLYRGAATTADPRRTGVAST
jgi:AAHS family 4-hydroxybenzoate transporter-like MFS transporter